MQYKAVISDLDGTLIPPGEFPIKEPSKRLQKAVLLCHKRGVLFTIATARSLYSLRPFVSKLTVSAPLILDNGATIFDPKRGKNIEDIFVSLRDTRRIAKFLHSLRVPYDIVLHSGRRVTSVADVNKGQIKKIVIADLAGKQATNLVSRLSKNFPVSVTRSIARIHPHTEAIHIMHESATKQKALIIVSALCKLSLPEIIGIGDSDNDIPLLNMCGLKVAMGNATKRVKKLADVIAPPQKDDGVAYILETYILA